MSPASSDPVQDRPTSAAWAEQVDRMDPDDLRMLALTLPVIEQAKGIVMGHFGCGATTAFTILSRWSSASNVPLRDLAAALVDEASRAVDRDDEQPRSAVQRFLRTREPG